MKNQLVKLTEEVAEAIRKAASSPEYQAVLKAAENKDTGSFEVIISTEHEDRMREVILQDGWQLERYKANPVVLWGHSHYDLPIGICTELVLTEFDGKKALKAYGKFADHEFAQTIRKLYDAKIVRTTSVGFIPKKWDENDRNVIAVAELLEFSFVSVPANPFALSTLGQLGYESAAVGALVQKGVLHFDMKTQDTENTDEAADAPGEVAAAEEAVDVDTEEKDAPAAAEEASEEADADTTVETTETEAEDEEKSLDERLAAKKAELEAVEEKISVFKALDVDAIKALVVALEALIPTEKQVELERMDGDQDEESATDPEGESNPEVETAKALLAMRKHMQQVAKIASGVLGDTRPTAEKLY